LGFVSEASGDVWEASEVDHVVELDLTVFLNTLVARLLDHEAITGCDGKRRVSVELDRRR
jgi:hypothetical protein